MNVRDRMHVVKTPFVKTHKVLSRAFAQKEQLQIQIRAFGASQLFHVKKIATALETQFATRTSVACAPNRTSATIVDIHVKN
jgi:hypothetical protein